MKQENNGVNEKRYSKLAVASFVLSMVFLPIFSLSLPFWGFSVWFMITPPVLIILLSLMFGIIALVRIKRSSGDLKGKGFAITGVIISLILFIFLIISYALSGFYIE